MVRVWKRMFEFMRFLVAKQSSVLRGILKDSFEIHHKMLSSPKGSPLNFASNIMPFVSNARKLPDDSRKNRSEVISLNLLSIVK